MTAAIEVEGVSKTFVPPLSGLRRLLRREVRVVTAVRDVSFRVARGEVFGLVGRNGYGKTTLVKSVAALLEPTVGQVRVLGHDTRRDPAAVHRSIGLVSSNERSFYWRLTGRQNLQFFGRLYAITPAVLAQRIERLATDFEVAPLLDQPFQVYSAGNKQRLALVRALLPQPAILILDEPTSALDPISAERFRGVVRRWCQEDEDRSVLITTHNLAEVEALCDRVGVMAHGRLAQCGSLSELGAHYGSPQTVRMALSDAPGDLCQRLAGTTDLRFEDGRWHFRHQADDDVLDDVLRAVHAAGAKVRRLETRTMGLQEILEAIEAEGSGA